MTWFKVDDTLAFHHKVVAAGNSAMGLWVRAGAMAAQQLTDGFVPTHMARAMGTAQDAKRLVEAGLWLQVDGGYRFHQWDERQPSRAKVEATREARAESGRIGGQRSGESRREATTKQIASGSVQQKRTPVPSRPVPSLITFVCRRLSGGTRDETTDDEIRTWTELAGRADLETELKAWLAYNADTDLRNPGASLRGWLKKAAAQAERAAPGCSSCLSGWAGEDAEGRPIPCPTCRPNVIPMRGAS